MKVEEIQSLARIMQDAGLTMLEVREGENKIRMEKQVPGVKTAAGCAESYTSVPDALQAAGAPAAKPAGAPEPKLKEVKSPMVGVFYAAPTPDAEPYVKVGSKVKKGDVLCVIEAMKLMNELNSDADGEVAEICAESGQVVEYGQTLFRLR